MLGYGEKGGQNLRILGQLRITKTSFQHIEHQYTGIINPVIREGIYTKERVPLKKGAWKVGTTKTVLKLQMKESYSNILTIKVNN